MIDAEILAKAREIVRRAGEQSLSLATAESCTGGLVAAALTAIEGSSAVFDRGFVTYSNEAKQELLGVSIESLAAHGAVSQTVAREMADGARTHAKVDLAVSITGIAGPGGGSAEKPVGLVHFALAGPQGVTHRAERFGAIGRNEVRRTAVLVALDLFEAALAASDGDQVDGASARSEPE